MESTRLGQSMALGSSSSLRFEGQTASNSIERAWNPREIEIDPIWQESFAGRASPRATVVF